MRSLSPISSTTTSSPDAPLTASQLNNLMMSAQHSGSIDRQHGRTGYSYDRTRQRREQRHAVYLGCWLTHQRIANALSIETLANSCGISPSLIVAVEAGLVKIDHEELNTILSSLCKTGECMAG